MDLLLDGDRELRAVWCSECVGGFDLFRVASVVLGCEKCVEGVIAHDVRVGWCTVVIGGEDGGRGIVLVHYGAKRGGDVADIVGFIEGCLIALGRVPAVVVWVGVRFEVWRVG